MRETEVPGGTYGLKRFRETVASSKPSDSPDELMVAMGHGAQPEAEFLLSSRRAASIPPGTIVEFSGSPKSFTVEPFLLTFDVVKFDVLPRK